MKTKLFPLFVLFIGLAVLGTACGPSIADASDEVGPESVVNSFYEWLLGYIGDPATGEFRNPTADGAFRSSPYLTAEFVQKVDDMLASSNRGGYDPFLCAQDIPEAIIVGEASVSGDSASVVTQQLWNVATEYQFSREVQVLLEKTGEEWKISDIPCR